MRKKRTKKQKQSPRHNFKIELGSGSLEPTYKISVKGQFNNSNKHRKIESSEVNKVDNTAISVDVVKIKKNILKSLILAALILASEFVLYFFWN